jgi:hypothetical protein
MMEVKNDQGKMTYCRFTVDSREIQSAVLGGGWLYKVKADDGALHEVREEDLKLS